MIEPITQDKHATLLALNNAHAAALSWLEPDSFAQMIDNAFWARCLSTHAFLLAFDQDAAYNSLNFLWFRQRYSRFVYIDRVVVAEAASGLGYARALYAALTTAAHAAGHATLCCEVNLVPANSKSDALHARLGFRPIAAETRSDKTVRYLIKQS